MQTAMGSLTGLALWNAWPTPVALHLDAWCLVALEGKQVEETQEEKNTQKEGLSNLQNRNHNVYCRSSATVSKMNRGNSC